jgi:hypothetical protein
VNIRKLYGGNQGNYIGNLDYLANGIRCKPTSFALQMQSAQGTRRSG